MADVVNVGTFANDPEADTAREGGIKINDKFAALDDQLAQANADGTQKRLDISTATLTASFRDDGSGNLGWYVGAAGAVDGAQVRVATINRTNGFVGYGTTNPSARLHVRPAPDVNLEFSSLSTSMRLEALNDARNAYIPLRLQAGTIELNPAGNNVAIGGAAAAHRLAVTGSASGGILTVVPGGATALELYNLSVGKSFAFFPITNGSDSDLGIYSNSGTPGTRLTLQGASGRMALGGPSNGFHKFCITENTNSLANLLISTTSLTAQPGITVSRLRPSGSVQNGDVLGSLQFTGYDGSTGSGQVSIVAHTDGVASAGSVPTGLTISTTPAGSLIPVRRLVMGNSGSVNPGADNTQPFGSSSFRWSVIYAGTGTINTSDATMKALRDGTSIGLNYKVSPLAAAEIAAAKAIVKEIGVFKWQAAIAEKGDAARLHIGLTVQRAIEIMESHGLDPWAYGFMCRDEITRKTKVVETRSVPATEEVEEAYSEIEVRDGVPVQVAKTRVVKRPLVEMIPVVDENGEAIMTGDEPAMHPVPVMEDREIEVEIDEPAGDRLGFRYDQLTLFILRGMVA